MSSMKPGSLTEGAPLAPGGSDAGARGRLVVVDDDPRLRRALIRHLRGAGLDVEGAADARTALDLIAHGVVDAVLCDIVMPGMDGLGLLRVVRERGLDTPVVLLTGAPTLNGAMQAVELGAMRYLLKPVDEGELVAAATQAVRIGALARVRRASAELAGDAGAKAAEERAVLGAAIETAFMAYQPIVSATANTIVAYEALLRGRSEPHRNPEAFVAAAGRAGMLHALGRAVRTAVASDIGEAAPDVSVFVNLHPLDLLDEDLFAPSSLLSRHAPRVVLEVTESASLEEMVDLRVRAARLRAAGFRLAIDDMGAGYAGMTTFVRLEPDIVKIDRALVRDVGTDTRKERVIAAMIALAHELGITVVCEGVETAAERNACVALGADLLQGYYFARPAPGFPPLDWA